MSIIQNFMITKCDVVEMIFETIRFLSHITLLHILNCTLDDSEDFLDIKFLKVMLITGLAVILYHIFIKKFFVARSKKLKSLCDGSN